MSNLAINLTAAQQRVLDVASYVAAEERHGEVRAQPYAPVVGATIRGLRIGSEPVSDAVKAFLNEQLLKRGFLVFEPGTVSGERFVELVRLFGEPKYTGTPYTPEARESALINTIDSKVKETRMNFIWHIDQGFKPTPPRFTALFGRNVPPYGGDTIFANATAAYDLLDPLFAQYLETLTAVHWVETQGFLSLAYHDAEALAQQHRDNLPVEAPVIRVHPETGLKQIFVNELYTLRIKGLSRIASQNILNILFDLVKSPEIEARVKWEEGSAVIWDNRTVQHRGVGDYGSGHRVLHRAIIA